MSSAKNNTTKAAKGTRSKAKAGKNKPIVAKAKPAESATNRQKDGRFGAGNCANPGGRPRLPAEVKEMCRELTPEAIGVAAAIMRDEEAPEASRLKAVEVIVNRAYGTPVQAVELNDARDLPPIIIEAPID